ncbi:hypothetical protein JCM8097_003336 [Rhodosporidiobolus ruineniae]
MRTVNLFFSPATPPWSSSPPADSHQLNASSLYFSSSGYDEVAGALEALSELQHRRCRTLSPAATASATSLPSEVWSLVRDELLHHARARAHEVEWTLASLVTCADCTDTARKHKQQRNKAREAAGLPLVDEPVTPELSWVAAFRSPATWRRLLLNAYPYDVLGFLASYGLVATWLEPQYGAVDDDGNEDERSSWIHAYNSVRLSCLSAVSSGSISIATCAVHSEDGVADKKTKEKLRQRLVDLKRDWAGVVIAEDPDMPRLSPPSTRQ